VVSYKRLLDVFWNSHTPTFSYETLQYRSVIFYYSEEQRIAAEESKKAREAELGSSIYSAIEASKAFYTAEDYHQKYYLQNVSELNKEMREIYPEFKDFLDSTAAARLNGYAAGNGDKETLLAELDKLGLSEKGRQKLLEITESRGLDPGCQGACAVESP